MTIILKFFCKDTSNLILQCYKFLLFKSIGIFFMKLYLSCDILDEASVPNSPYLRNTDRC